MKRIRTLLLAFAALAAASVHATPRTAGQTLTDLPPQTQMGLSEAMGRSQVAYQAVKTAHGYRMGGHQSPELSLSRQGAEVSGWRLSLSAWGRGAQMHPTEAVSPEVKGNRVEYRRAGVTEWYVNGPLGLEQGFTLNQAATGRGSDDAPVALQLKLPSAMTAKLANNKKDLVLIDQDGHQVLRYGKLAAWDADGKALNASFEVANAAALSESAELLIKVGDRDARYPVTVDPLIQQAELNATDGASSNSFAYSVALSNDGSTALVGAPGKNSNQGTAYVFTRTGSTWTQQQELTASDGAANDSLGTSVALSNDGSTALVGAPGKNSNQGAAYVFTRTGSTWTQQQELTASDGVSPDSLGNSVSLSGDGLTAVLGASRKNLNQGAAYIFAKTGLTWNQIQKLSATDGAAGDGFGYSVFLSSDSSTALVGAVSKYSDQGAAYIFMRSGSVWTQQQELTAIDGASGNEFGTRVALSGDGATALVSAGGKSSYQGASYIFTLNGSIWNQQQELTAQDGVANDQFGYGVALNSDGSTALVGARGKTVNGNSGQGAAYVYYAPAPPLIATQSIASVALTQNFAANSFVAVAGSGGTPPLSYNINPQLPNGLTLLVGSGAISGTPTATSQATTYTVTVTDTNNATASNTFVLTVNPPVLTTQVTSSVVLTQNQVANAFIPVTATGGTGTLTYSIAGSLPANLNFSTSNGQISGTPIAASSATTYTVTATDANGATASNTFSLTINPAVAASQSVASKSLTLNRATGFTPVAGSGGTGSLTYTVSPSLSAGLALNSTSGTISGTPTASSLATTYAVTVTDANNATASTTFVLTVNPTVTATQNVATVSLPQNQAVTSTTPVTGSGGTPPLSYAISPALPAGLSFSTSSGAITGTPTSASNSTTYAVTITDANGATASNTFSLAVIAAPTVTAVSPNGGSTAGGSPVIITGTAFTNVSAVSFGGTPASNVNVVSSTQIAATSPAGTAGTVDVTVTTPGGTSVTSSADRFTYAARQTGAMTPTQGGGTVQVVLGNSAPAGCAIDTANTAPFQPPANTGLSTPYGGLKVRVIGCPLGATVPVTVTWAPASGIITTASKYGPTPTSPGASVVYAPAGLQPIGGNANTGYTITYNITDNGLGDDTFTGADGIINDPIIPGAGSADTSGIPTLTEWGQLILGSLLAFGGVAFIRRRRMPA